MLHLQASNKRNTVNNSAADVNPVPMLGKVRNKRH